MRKFHTQGFLEQVELYRPTNFCLLQPGSSDKLQCELYEEALTS